MKTKNSSSAPRDSTQGEIRYCNYYLHFPDGDVWHDSTCIAGGLFAWVKNTALYRVNMEAARKLIKSGEYHWKEKNGVTHRMVIAREPVSRKWGLNQKIVHRSGKDQ